MGLEWTDPAGADDARLYRLYDRFSMAIHRVLAVGERASMKAEAFATLERQAELLEGLCGRVEDLLDELDRIELSPVGGEDR